MQNEQLRTTGELRAFLADAIKSVRSGELAVDKASVMQKMAAQINENLYAEAKITQMRADDDADLPKMGTLRLD